MCCTEWLIKHKTHPHPSRGTGFHQVFLIDVVLKQIFTAIFHTHKQAMQKDE